MFTNGTLPDFTGSAQDANDLQAAIWFIEQEVAPYGVTNHFVDQANDEIALGGAWFGMGLGDVNVINLMTVAGGPAQDLLTRTPVPSVSEPSMMILFGGGMLGLAFAARKRFFKR
jgi:hypothetical protein